MNREKNSTPISLGKSAATLTFAKVITLLLSMATGMLLSRFRTVEEYGTFSQLLISVSLATSIFTLGLPNSTNYFLARAETNNERRSFLSNYYTVNSMLCLITGVVLLLAEPFIVDYYQNAKIAEFSFFLLIYPWTMITISSVSNVLVVYGKPQKLMCVNIITSCVTICSIILVKLLKLGFREYLWAYLIGQIGITLWVYIIVLRLERGLKPQFSLQIVKKILVYSIPIGLASMVGTISIEVDKLMIGRLFDTESLAIYTNAAKELPLNIVAASFTAVLMPHMARRLKNKDVKGALNMWGHSIELSYFIICFFAMACVVFAPNIISILYSNKYLPGVAVFRVYSLVMLLRVTYFGLVLNSIGKTKFIFYCSLITLALNAVLNYLFYLLFGFVGPAIATFISIALTGGLQVICTAKELKIKVREIFPWSNLLKITIINACFGIVIYGVVLLSKIGTDLSGNICAIVIGFVFLVIYAICIKKKGLYVWRKLNEKE